MALFTSLISYFSVSTPTEPTVHEYPFVLADGGVNYSFRETFNCQYLIAGNIEFLDENSIDSEHIVIKMQPLGTYDNRPPANAYIGSDNSYGLIIVGNYWYYVWVHDLTLDVPLSEEILVDDLDCRNDRILATVNFRQVLPLD